MMKQETWLYKAYSCKYHQTMFSGFLGGSLAMNRLTRAAAVYIARELRGGAQQLLRKRAKSVEERNGRLSLQTMNVV